MGRYHNTLAQDIGPVDPESPGGVRVIHAGEVYEATGDVEEQILEMPGQEKVSDKEAEAIDAAKTPVEGDELGEQEKRRRAVAAALGGSQALGTSDPAAVSGAITTSEAVPQVPSEPPVEAPAEASGETQGDLSKLTVAELKDLADKRGVTVTRGDGKDSDPVKSDYVEALS